MDETHAWAPKGAVSHITPPYRFDGGARASQGALLILGGWSADLCVH